MNNKNMRLFIDMDGTLAKWNNVEFEQLFEKGYYRNLEPNAELVSEVNKLVEQGEDIYILSCVLPESAYALEEKKEWLREHVPNLPEDKYIFVPYGKNKADYLKEHYSPITNHDYLIDDYTQNLQEWKEYGGIGVKFLNGINHTRGTWKGLMIYDFNGSSYHENLSVSLTDLVISENLKDYGIAMIASHLHPEYWQGYQRYSYSSYSCVYDSKFFNVDLATWFVEDPNNIEIKEIVNRIRTGVYGESADKAKLHQIGWNNEAKDQYYSRHYPCLEECSVSRDFHRLIDEIDYNTLDNMEHTLYLYDTGKITLGDGVYKYSIDESVGKQRVLTDSITWARGGILTEDFIENIKSNERHYPNLSKYPDSDKIIQELDDNALDRIEYALYLFDAGKITIGKSGECIIDEGIDKQSILMDSIRWVLGIIDTEDFLENIKSDVKDKSPQEQEKKSMKERLSEAQNKANQKNDQTKEHAQKDRTNQVL